MQLLKKIKAAPDCRAVQSYRSQNGRKSLDSIRWISPSLGLETVEKISPEVSADETGKKGKSRKEKHLPENNEKGKEEVEA